MIATDLVPSLHYVLTKYSGLKLVNLLTRLSNRQFWYPHVEKTLSLVFSVGASQL